MHISDIFFHHQLTPRHFHFKWVIQQQGLSISVFPQLSSLVASKHSSGTFPLLLPCGPLSLPHIHSIIHKTTTGKVHLYESYRISLTLLCSGNINPVYKERLLLDPEPVHQTSSPSSEYYSYIILSFILHVQSITTRISHVSFLLSP